MKKTITLTLICLLVIMSLTACVSTNTSEVADIRQREEVSTESTNNVTEKTENNTQLDVDMMDCLDAQVELADPDDLIKVTQCNFSTSEDLLAVASKCVTLDKYQGNYSKAEEWQIKIAANLAIHPATTDAIMVKLVESPYPSVWMLVAISPSSSETTLMLVARKCVTCSKTEEWQQLTIAELLACNSSTTNAVMAELEESPYPSVVSFVQKIEYS